MAYTVLAYTVLSYTLIGLVSMMRVDAKAMPTNVTDYGCHIKAIELIYSII